MDAKSTKVLDGAADNLKQNQATQNVAHLAGFLAPISVPANTRRTPRPPWIPFRVLLAAIRNMVPHNIMFQIIRHYEQFLACKVGPSNAYLFNEKISLMYHIVLVESKKISCDDFVWQLRLIVGDDIMTSAINKVKFKVPNLFILNFLIWF